MNYYLNIFKKYAIFKGRSSRAEFWNFVLFNFIVSIIISGIDSLIKDHKILIMLYLLVITIPSLALSVRRMHDVEKSGWFLLINLIPMIGAIWIFVLMVSDSDPKDNKYGPNPKRKEAAEYIERTE